MSPSLSLPKTLSQTILRRNNMSVKNQICFVIGTIGVLALRRQVIAEWCRYKHDL